MPNDTFKDDLNTPRWKPLYKSEFSMGDRDFERYHTILTELDKINIELNSTSNIEFEIVSRYFALLNILYMNFRALISSIELKKTLDDAFLEARMQKIKWEHCHLQGLDYSRINKMKLVFFLDSIHKKLLDIKQTLGLGLHVKKSFDVKERIKNATRISKKEFSDLPEP